MNKEIYRRGNFSVKITQNGFYLYHDEVGKISECIYGRESLKKYHKNSFDQWIKNTTKRLKKRNKKIESQIDDLHRESRRNSTIINDYEG